MYILYTPDPTFNVISAVILEGDDTKTKFYTGLPRWALFTCMNVFHLLSSHMTPSCNSLTLRDEFVVVLIKLRFRSPFQDLACCNYYETLYVSQSEYCITFLSSDRDGRSGLVRLICANIEAVWLPFHC